MNVNIDANDIIEAAKRGLELLRSDIQTPNRWNAELVCLDLLLQNVVEGRMEIRQVEQTPPMSIDPNNIDIRNNVTTGESLNDS
jgi:hypothetical protein